MKTGHQTARSLRCGMAATSFLAGALMTLAGSARADTTYTFSLVAGNRANAEVFDTQGRHVRTLLRGANLGSGSHTLTWDNLDDNGSPVPATQRDANGNTVPALYEIRVLQTAVTYTWEGVIGNSSSSFTGTGVFRSYLPPSSLAATSAYGGTGALFFTTGYNEAQPVSQGFYLNDQERRSCRFA